MVTNMKRLFELLKSLKDWHKVGVIIALIFGVIQTVPIIKEWFSPTPEAELYLGNIKTEDCKKIIMHYMIPSNPDNLSDYIVPFPLKLVNNSDKNIRNLSLEIEVEPKVLYKERMKKFILRAYASENFLHLKSNKPDEESNTQIIMNTGENKVLYAGYEIKDFLEFHVTKDSCDLGVEGLWESFPVIITINSNNTKKKIFPVEIRFYNACSEKNVIKEITNETSRNTSNIIIRTLIDKYAKNEKGEVYGCTFKVSRKENALQLIE